MPRDDLSIDFVKSMPPGGESLDPALILDDWINRVANLPEEIRFLQEEIAAKDREYNECLRIIDDKDSRIQKFIKANGSHETNPKEDGLRKQILENFDKAEILADEKIALSNKMKAVMDRHIRQLDMQLKHLYDRNEAGFTDPDEVPSLLRPSAANIVQPSIRSSSSRPSALNGFLKESSSTTHAAASSSSSSSSTGGGGGNGNRAVVNGRGPNHVQSRQNQVQSASAPASPAASMILGRQTREGSAGPPSKRGPRLSSGLGNAPTTSSGLARHSSLGPGTPKGSHHNHHHQTATGTQRAGSAGPRSTTKGTGSGPGRKAGTPSASSSLAAAAAAAVGGGSGPGGRKKGGTGSGTPTLKTSLSRVKRPARHSAASSTAESELSDPESASESNSSSRRGTPARGSSSQGGNGSGGNGGGGGGGANGNGNGNGNAGSNGNGGGSGGNSNGGDKDTSSMSGPKVKRESSDSAGLTTGNLISSTGSSSGVHHHRHGGGAAVKHGPGGRGAGSNSAAAAAAAAAAANSDDKMDLDDDEAGDDRKYCLCQNVSFGDMVACDNEHCPYEWFHWTCVGLKSEPNGTWYCPVCTAKMSTRGGGSGGSGSGNSTGTHHHKAPPAGAGGGGGGSRPAAATAASGAAAGTGPANTSGQAGQAANATGNGSGSGSGSNTSSSTGTGNSNLVVSIATRKGK